MHTLFIHIVSIYTICAGKQNRWHYSKTIKKEKNEMEEYKKMMRRNNGTSAKNSPLYNIFIGIIAIIMCIFFVGTAISNYVGLNGDLLNMNDATKDDLKYGRYVEIDVDLAYGSYCENVETTNYIFKRTTEQYYLIDTCQDYAYFIGLNIAEGKKDDLESLTNYTFSDGSATSPGVLHYKGKLKSQSDELYGYMKDYLYDLYGVTTAEDKAEIDSWTLPYYIEIMDSSSYTFNIIMGIIFLIIGIALILSTIIKKKKAANFIDATTPVTPTPYDETGSPAGDYSYPFMTNNMNSTSNTASAPATEMTENDSIPFNPGTYGNAVNTETDYNDNYYSQNTNDSDNAASDSFRLKD